MNDTQIIIDDPYQDAKEAAYRKKEENYARSQERDAAKLREFLDTGIDSLTAPHFPKANRAMRRAGTGKERKEQKMRKELADRLRRRAMKQVLKGLERNREYHAGGRIAEC